MGSVQTCLANSQGLNVDHRAQGKSILLLSILLCVLTTGSSLSTEVKSEEKIIAGSDKTDKNDAFFSLSLQELMNLTVTTTSKYAEPISNSPANITVFSREEIQQRGYRNIEDLLQAIPGVHLQKYSILGIYNSVTFRGALGNNKFLILQDGIRLNTPAGETAAIGNQYPLYYAKQVEVLMGPASVVYGADAFMGVINIITQDNDTENQGEVSLSTGNKSYNETYAQWHQNFSHESFLNLGLQAFHSQDYEFAKDFPELYNDPTDPSKEYQFSPTKDLQFFVNFRLNSQWQFGLNYAAQSSSAYFTAKPSFSTFDKGAAERIKQTTAYAKFTTNISPTLRSTSLLTAMNYTLDKKSFFRDNFTGGEKGYKYANSDRISLNQDFEYKYKENHIISGGLVYDYFDTIPRSADLSAPYDTSKEPSEQDLNYLNTTLSIQFFERQYYNAGIYIQDNWEIDPQWRLVTGLRFDDNSFYGNSVNPRVSGIYKYDNRNRFKLLYGHAFLAPGPDQASTHFGGFSGAQNSNGEWVSAPFSPFRIPNNEIKPETVKTLELNYEHEFDHSAYLKIAPFFNRIEDAILRKPDDIAEQAIPGAELLNTVKMANVGKKETYGIDISFDQQTVVDAWSFKTWAYFSLLDGSMTDQGQKLELPMVSRYKLNVGSIITYKNTYLLTPKLSWIDTTTSNQRDPSDNNKMLQVPAYFLVDLHGEIRISASASVKLDIYNMLDKKYVNAPFANPFFTLNQAAQPGRLGVFNLSIRF
ncbi:MAG: TonB-dependent receptor plug domain-containing protein [Thiohalomonadales bacterium]